jgi:hypothetical protein
MPKTPAEMREEADRLERFRNVVPFSRSQKDAIDAMVRELRALAANNAQRLSTEQLRRIGLTPKGFRSSTGRRPWTQPRYRAAA